MRGRVAKQLRQAARRILGPDAPHTTYAVVRQRSGTGGQVHQAVFAGPDGKPQCIVLRVYKPDEHGRMRRHYVPTEAPIYKTFGIEPRLTPDCVKGLAQKFKDKYRRLHARTIHPRP